MCLSLLSGQLTLSISVCRPSLLVPTLTHPTVQPPARGVTLLLRFRRSDARLSAVVASYCLLAYCVPQFYDYKHVVWIKVCTSEKCRPSIKQWSIWRVPGFEVYLFLHEVRGAVQMEVYATQIAYSHQLLPSASSRRPPVTLTSSG
jgi:hypothetical protein